MATTSEDGTQHFLRHFSDPEATTRYTQGPPRFLPGLEAMHRMTGILLAEAAPSDANILVLGAGGGMELLALAETQPGWRFTGVDPAGPMLRLAEQTAAPFMDRIELVEGYIDDAPEGPFDGAICLLTLHFLMAEDRLATIRANRQRLRPGAPFVAVHGCLPKDRPARDIWLDRYAAYPLIMGVEPEQVAQARASVDAAAPMLEPAQDEILLKHGGFPDAELFFAAFTWRGWIGHAA
ncbi:MAG TPA: class I SAM-dependent methyltransferase [Sphingomonadaceae bacterium]|nr:class I SAM-dependent methyltransferase [Sphingomonadaceae bacterium]